MKRMLLYGLFLLHVLLENLLCYIITAYLPHKWCLVNVHLFYIHTKINLGAMSKVCINRSNLEQFVIYDVQSQTADYQCQAMLEGKLRVYHCTNQCKSSRMNRVSVQITLISMGKRAINNHDICLKRHYIKTFPWKQIKLHMLPNLQF